jgi:hypothetical protein
MQSVQASVYNRYSLFVRSIPAAATQAWTRMYELA